MNALSYWFYLFSGVLIAFSFFQGGAYAGGWTMYAPLNVPTYTPAMEATTGGNATILGLMLFVISITIGTVNFLVTIHRSRAEGLGLWNMPIFTWSWLLTVWMMLFAFAALLAALLLLATDRVFLTVLRGRTGFEPAVGAPVLVLRPSGGLYRLLPALGIMFETFQTFTGRRLVGRKWVIIAMVLVAVQSFLVWMHHMYLTTINLEIKTLMMATTIGISLPFDLMVFALIYDGQRARPVYDAVPVQPGRTRTVHPRWDHRGVPRRSRAGLRVPGTYWVVAHFHYVMVSGVTALVAGLYYWWPKISGKMYSETLGKINFAVYFVGFNLLYFPQFLAWETPRRVFHFAEGAEFYHQLSTVGAFVFGASFLIMFATFAHSYLYGPRAPDNPWEYSRTAEWAVPSPPPLENWTGRPSYRTGNLEFVEDSKAATDGGVAQGEAAAAEVASTHEEDHPDHASIWPLGIGISTFLFFFGLTGITPYIAEFAQEPRHRPKVSSVWLESRTSSIRS